MSKSLQDQLLGAGLVDKKKAKDVDKQKRKQKKVDNRTKNLSPNDAQMAAKKVLEDKKLKDTELNRQRQMEAEQKAIYAQVVQLIEHYKVKKSNVDPVEYNFADGKLIKKVWVGQEQMDHLSRGRLCIAKIQDRYELLPKPVADKIRERTEDAVVVYNFTAKPQNSSAEIDSAEESTAVQDEDDAYYAQFEIPDDLVW